MIGRTIRKAGLGKNIEFDVGNVKLDMFFRHYILYLLIAKIILIVSIGCQFHFTDEESKVERI